MQRLLPPSIPKLSRVPVARHLLDGHPASSKLDLLEGMIKKTIDHLTSHPDLFG
jgi:hypothetical protein